MLETLTQPLEGSLVSEVGQASIEKLFNKPTTFVQEIDRLPRLIKAAKTEIFIATLFEETMAQEEDMNESQLEACKLTRTLITHTISRVSLEIKQGNNSEEKRRANTILRELKLYHTKGILPVELIPNHHERVAIKGLITNFQAIDYENKYMNRA